MMVSIRCYFLIQSSLTRNHNHTCL